MTTQHRLLCPVDFSDLSRGALHYALAIGRRFRIPVTVLTVDDPEFAPRHEDVRDCRCADDSEKRLRRFVEQSGVWSADVTYEVRRGHPATAILEMSQSPRTSLIVMGTHGRKGVRRFLFGATAERVLRDTRVPVLLVPSDPGPLSFEALAMRASPMLVPVDFSSTTARQVKIAAGIAGALGIHVLIGHVLEPIELPASERAGAAELMSERYRRAYQVMQSLALDSALSLAPELLISTGLPADTIARWTSTNHVGLLVMALHDHPAAGPRIGPVTYRAVSLSRVLTLALPALPASEALRETDREAPRFAVPFETWS